MYSPDELHVVYASDDHYSPLMGVSMVSLFARNQWADKITVYLLDYGISQENRQKILDIAAQYQRQVVFTDVNHCLERLDLHMGPRKIAITSYARLFICELVPDTVDRLIYLDCDTIVNDTLQDMWTTDLGSALVAGVQDSIDRSFIHAIDMDPAQRYINAGMLLINLKAWREVGLQDRFMAYIREKDGNVQFHDQGVINHVCADRRLILPLRYNVTSNTFSFSVKLTRRMFDMDEIEYYTQPEVEEARQSPAIIHFTAGVLGRPWETACEHPCRSLYQASLDASPWKGRAAKPNTQSFLVRAASFVCNHISSHLFV